MVAVKSLVKATQTVEYIQTEQGKAHKENKC